MHCHRLNWPVNHLVIVNIIHNVFHLISWSELKQCVPLAYCNLGHTNSNLKYCLEWIVCKLGCGTTFKCAHLSSLVSFSISEEDPGPLRSDSEGKVGGTKVSRTFSYLKSKMSKKNKVGIHFTYMLCVCTCACVPEANFLILPLENQYISFKACLNHLRPY